MKSASCLALAAALALSFSPMSFAQTAGASVDAAGGARLDAATDTADSATGAGTKVGANAGASAQIDASLDVDGDGTISAEEQAAGGNASRTGGNVSGGATTGASASGGTSGSGTTTTSGTGGAAAAGAATTGTDGDTGECPAIDFSSMASWTEEDMAVLNGATNAQIIMVSGCDDDDATVSTISSTTNADLNAAVFANQNLAAQLATQGIGSGEVVGVDLEGGNVVIYVEDNSAEEDGGSISGEGAARSETGGSTSGSTTTDTSGSTEGSVTTEGSSN